MSLRVFPALFLFVSLPTAIAQQQLYAPLPDKITSAKAVFLVNDSGEAKLGDEVYRELRHWHHWEVVTDKQKADLVLVVNQQDSVAGYISSASATAVGQSASATGIAVPVKAQRWYLHVIDNSTGQRLWTADATMGGKLWRTWGAIAKSLVGDIQKRMQ